MISIKILSKPPTLNRVPLIIEALAAKMDMLMVALQNKVKGETIPRYFKTAGPLAASVVKLPTRVEGTKITGAVKAGGELTLKVTQGGANAGQKVDYAGVQEYGVAHDWVINPVLLANAQAMEYVRLRLRRDSSLPEALAFLWNGKKMILRRVTHPALEARPFMRAALKEMTPEIIAGLRETANKELGI
jgi:hypothetical protein